MQKQYFDGRVIVKSGNITLEAVDAIVNAANWTLLGGGGVDGAIHAAGGPEIVDECRKIRESEYPSGLPTGHAVITSGGLLPAKHVIHTVGPIYGQARGQDESLLADCYVNSIKLAEMRGLTTIAFPSISTGAFGFPKVEAAKVVGRTISDLLSADVSLKEIRLVFFSENDVGTFIRHSGFER